MFVIFIWTETDRRRVYKNSIDECIVELKSHWTIGPDNERLLRRGRMMITNTLKLMIVYLGSEKSPFPAVTRETEEVEPSQPRKGCLF